jgi:hypothetical protein
MLCISIHHQNLDGAVFYQSILLNTCLILMRSEDSKEMVFTIMKVGYVLSSSVGKSSFQSLYAFTLYGFLLSTHHRLLL